MHVMTNHDQIELSNMVLCLEFANRWRVRDDRNDGSHFTYANLVEWAVSVALLAPADADELRIQAFARANDSSMVVRRAITLGEVLYRVFSALAADSSPATTDVEALNTALGEALPRLRLRRGGHCCRWTWSVDDEALDRMLWPVARSAADLLTSDRITRVRECASETCSWLFLDTSRNGRRKWCDMATCGNRAKARRYYRRRRGPTASDG